MHKPPLLLEHAVYCFPIDDEPVLELQQHPQSSIPKGGVVLNPLAQPLRPRRVGHPTLRLALFRPIRAGSVHPEYLAASSF